MFDPDHDWWTRMPPPPAEVRQAIPELDDMPAEQRSSLGWTTAIAARDAEIIQIARDVPFFSHSAIGLVSRTVDDGLTADSLPFGVILYAAGSVAHHLDQGWRRAIRFPSLGIDIPVVIRRGIFTPASSSAPAKPGPAPARTPSGGSYACWATWRNGVSQGWLTARHVARAGPPADIVDEAADCVDAALIALPVPNPVNPVPTSISAQAPRAQLPVQLDFRPGTPTSTVILDVSDTLGMKNPSPKFPLRISTQAAGKNGNSGSLITEGGMPFGIYLGHFSPAKAPATSSGVGLVLSQLKILVDMEVFA